MGGSLRSLGIHIYIYIHLYGTQRDCGGGSILLQFEKFPDTDREDALFVLKIVLLLRQKVACPRQRPSTAQRLRSDPNPARV